MLAAAAWIFFLLMSLWSASCLIFNAACVVLRFFKPRVPSLVPLAGGMVGAAALHFTPILWLRPYWWVPLALDASYPLFILALVRVLRTRFNP